VVRDRKAELDTVPQQSLVSHGVISSHSPQGSSAAAAGNPSNGQGAGAEPMLFIV
jgi:hypothetical protein